jgi:hypothetical protein
MTESLNGNMTTMPDEVGAGELLEEVRSGLVKQANFRVLNFPPAGKLFDYEQAVAPNFEVRRSG